MKTRNDAWCQCQPWLSQVEMVNAGLFGDVALPKLYFESHDPADPQKIPSTDLLYSMAITVYK